MLGFVVILLNFCISEFICATEAGDCGDGMDSNTSVFIFDKDNDLSPFHRQMTTRLYWRLMTSIFPDLIRISPQVLVLNV